MIDVRHLNMGWLHKPPVQPACCHGLLVTDGDSIVLIDTGIGLADIADPTSRIGKETIERSGFRFFADVAVATQLDVLGLDPRNVTDIVLTHADPDHAGGLHDFPDATVHVAAEELAAVRAGSTRYSARQFAHGPKWCDYAENDVACFGLPARRVSTRLGVSVSLVPLFGHTRGHCGVAIETPVKSVLHVGDAYYLRAELSDREHPVGALASLAAEDDALRRESLERLRHVADSDDPPHTMFGYHDTAELPPGIPSFDQFVRPSGS